MNGNRFINRFYKRYRRQTEMAVMLRGTSPPDQPSVVQTQAMPMNLAQEEVTPPHSDYTQQSQFAAPPAPNPAPLQRAAQVPAAPTQISPPAAAPAPIQREVPNRPAPAPSAAPTAPQSPAVDPYLAYQATAQPETEDGQLDDRTWGRLQNIFKKHQDKEAEDPDAYAAALQPPQPEVIQREPPTPEEIQRRIAEYDIPTPLRPRPEAVKKKAEPMTPVQAASEPSIQQERLPVEEAPPPVGSSSMPQEQTVTPNAVDEAGPAALVQTERADSPSETTPLARQERPSQSSNRPESAPTPTRSSEANPPVISRALDQPNSLAAPTSQSQTEVAIQRAESPAGDTPQAVASPPPTSIAPNVPSSAPAPPADIARPAQTATQPVVVARSTSVTPPAPSTAGSSVSLSLSERPSPTLPALTAPPPPPSVTQRVSAPEPPAATPVGPQPTGQEEAGPEPRGLLQRVRSFFGFDPQPSNDPSPQASISESVDGPASPTTLQRAPSAIPPVVSPTRALPHATESASLGPTLASTPIEKPSQTLPTATARPITRQVEPSIPPEINRSSMPAAQPTSSEPSSSQASRPITRQPASPAVQTASTNPAAIEADPIPPPSSPPSPGSIQAAPIAPAGSEPSPQSEPHPAQPPLTETLAPPVLQRANQETSAQPVSAETGHTTPSSAIAPDLGAEAKLPVQREVLSENSEPKRMTESPPTIQRQETVAVDRPAQTPAAPSLSLDKVWPVKTLDQPTPPLSPASPQVIRKPDQQDEAIMTKLQSVSPGQATDSGIMFNPPRRPRPKIARKKKAETLPPSSSTEAAQSHNEAQTPSIQRTEAESAQTVQTEIGPLPSDLWELIDEPVPQGQPQSEPQDAESQIQTMTLEAAAPPNMNMEIDSQTVQREPAPLSESREEAPVEPVEEVAGSDEKKSEDEIDIDALAQQVYSKIRRKLGTELERKRFY